MASSELFKRYMSEVGNHRILTKDDEYTLGSRIKVGDKRAVTELIKHNLKLVIVIANEYRGINHEFCDIVNDGNVGLITAANRFDHTRGVRFSTYASWWIRQSIMKSLTDNARTIRLPKSIIQKLNLIYKQVNEQNITEVSSENLPDIGFDVDKIIKYTDLDVGKTYSMDSNFNSSDGDDYSRYNFISTNDVGDSDSADVTFNITNDVNDNIGGVIEKMLNKLPVRDRNIMRDYCGMNETGDALSLEKIGEKYNITLQRVHQIKKKSITKLRLYAIELVKLI
jgi:RNA polymerase primary sigma factor